jgi:hypothetical protein
MALILLRIKKTKIGKLNKLFNGKIGGSCNLITLKSLVMLVILIVLIFLY